MNLQESIRRILNEELPSKINESFTGETPTEIEQQFINKPVKLIGDVNTNTIIKKLNVNKDGSVNITFQNGMKVNSSIPMLRRFDIGVDIPLKFNVRKKTIVNESDESRQERKFTKLLNNIEEYINSNSYNSVVRVMVDYDEVMDDVIVNIFFDAEHAVKLGGGINSVIKRSGKKIMEDLSVFPFDFKYHIHFEKPQLNESIKKILKEETEGIDSFLDEISSKHNMSDELKDFVKQFIEESDCKRINFSRFKMGVMGLALESGVLINSVALNHPLPFLLFLIFHEVAHQYQFKKYGEDVMYDCYLGEISEREAAEFMKHTEEVADDFAFRKIRQLQKLNLIGPYTPPQMYKNVPIQQITMMVNNYREDMIRKNIDSPKKVSEYFYNMVKSEL